MRKRRYFFNDIIGLGFLLLLTVTLGFIIYRIATNAYDGSDQLMMEMRLTYVGLCGAWTTLLLHAVRVIFDDRPGRLRLFSAVVDGIFLAGTAYLVFTAWRYLFAMPDAIVDYLLDAKTQYSIVFLIGFSALLTLWSIIAIIISDHRDDAQMSSLSEETE